MIITIYTRKKLIAIWILAWKTWNCSVLHSSIAVHSRYPDLLKKSLPIRCLFNRLRMAYSADGFAYLGIRQLTITSNVMVTSRSSTNRCILASRLIRKIAGQFISLIAVVISSMTKNVHICACAAAQRQWEFSSRYHTESKGDSGNGGGGGGGCMWTSIAIPLLYRESDYKYWQQLSIYVLSC